MFFKKKKIEKTRHYFDYAAATPLDATVAEVIAFHQIENYANPGALHLEGVMAKRVLEDSRKSISQYMSAHPDEIVFTSGGTESDVLALRGIVSHALAQKSFKGKPHVLISAIEHSAVLDTVLEMEGKGLIELSLLPVNSDGEILMSEIKNYIKKTTVLVSVMYSNNEIGVIQDIQSLSKEVRRMKKQIHGERRAQFPLIHTDASQAIPFLSVQVLSLGIDLLSCNSGKIHGPKGVGLLFVKRGVKIEPLFYGGSQEQGVRPGTEPVPLIAGFAKAFEIASENREKESLRLQELKKYFIQKLESLQSDTELNSLSLDLKINGSKTNTSPHILHLSIKGLESDQLVIELDARGIAVSAKSACKTLDPQTSHVLSAIGYTDNSWGSLRFSFGKSTNRESIDFAVVALTDTIKKLLHTKQKFSL